MANVWKPPILLKNTALLPHKVDAEFGTNVTGQS